MQNHTISHQSSIGNRVSILAYYHSHIQEQEDPGLHVAGFGLLPLILFVTAGERHALCIDSMH